LHDECKGMSTFPSYSFDIMEEAENYGYPTWHGGKKR
jgi:hypothetical protein